MLRAVTLGDRYCAISNSERWRRVKVWRKSVDYRALVAWALAVDAACVKVGGWLCVAGGTWVRPLSEQGVA